MKKMSVFDLYMDDGEATYKVTVPAFSKKDAKAYVEGNGTCSVSHHCIRLSEAF